VTDAEFHAAFDQHKDAIFRFAWRMSSSPAAAEDITQDVFVALLGRPERFNPARGSLRAFLIGIARNLVLKRWRDDERWDLLDEEQFVAPPLNIEQSEIGELVGRAVQSLPPLQREVVILGLELFISGAGTSRRDPAGHQSTGRFARRLSASARSRGSCCWRREMKNTTRVLAVTCALVAIVIGHLVAQTSRVEGGVRSLAGVDFYWETHLVPPVPPLNDSLGMLTLTSGSSEMPIASGRESCRVGCPDTVHRVMTDRSRKVYFGYDAQVTVVKNESDTRYRIAFGPLTLTPELQRILGPDAGTWKLLPAPRFPAPRAA